jgi:hypothetical protein
MNFAAYSKDSNMITLLSEARPIYSADSLLVFENPEGMTKQSHLTPRIHAGHMYEGQHEFDAYSPQ